MNEQYENEEDLEENPYVEIPASADKEDDVDLDFPKRKNAVREKFGADDPDFDVLWDLSVRELRGICDDEDHPLHDKANRFLTIAMEPLRETMKNVVLPIFESMPKPDLSGISNMLSSISESIKPTIDVSAFNNILKGINIPQVDTSILFPQIEVMKLIPQTETMKLLANYDLNSIYSGIDFSAITSAVDTSSWLSSIAPSLPKYEISSEWRTALEAASHISEEDDQHPDRNFVESADEHANEETSIQESPSSISQEVELIGSPQELMAYELVEVVASRVDGVNDTLQHFLDPMLQVMVQSAANTADANAKIEEANRLSVLANNISDQANRIIEEAGKSSDEINNKMLTRASWSAWWRVALSGSSSPRIGKCDSGYPIAPRVPFVIDSLRAKADALALNELYEGVAHVEYRLPKNYGPVVGAAQLSRNRGDAGLFTQECLCCKEAA